MNYVPRSGFGKLSSHAWPQIFSLFCVTLHIAVVRGSDLFPLPSICIKCCSRCAVHTMSPHERVLPYQSSRILPEHDLVSAS